jgi:restriction system protein
MTDFIILYGPPVIIMVIIGIFLHRRLLEKPAYRGWWGEYKVNLMLRLCLSSEYKLYANTIYRGQHKGESTQVDHIVVSRYGIFVIETKTLKGKIIVDELNSDQWIQIVGRRRYTLDHPLKQNYAHIRSLQRITGAHSQKIFSYAVMAGSAVFEGQRPERVFSTWELVRKIQSKKTPVLSRAGVNSACQRLRRCKIKGGYWAARHHVARLQRRSLE